MKLDYSDPRTTGRKAVKDSVPADIWTANSAFVDRLQAKLAKHPIVGHPVKEFFETETLDKEKTKQLHLEFGYAFAQIFTDAVLTAMAKATDLENRHGPRSKVTARFLWALNLMDEIGYMPGDNNENYKGNPFAAHYFQYVKLYEELGMSVDAIKDFKPSKAAVDSRATMEEYYGDYQMLTTVLAYAESIFDRFAGAWADNASRSAGIDISEGYHTIHVEDEHGDSIDDDHSEDSWTLVRQALDPARHDEIEKKAGEWLDTWYRFADSVIEIATK